MESRPVTVTRLLTVGEIADYLRVNPTTIYRRLKRQELPAFKVGGNWRLKRGENRPLACETGN
jgi:excisionase family DNA binding protein